jgi:hypothetical protein
MLCCCMHCGRAGACDVPGVGFAFKLPRAVLGRFRRCCRRGAGTSRTLPGRGQANAAAIDTMACASQPVSQSAS